MGDVQVAARWATRKELEAWLQRSEAVGWLVCMLIN